jgi:hypothetical protein
MTRIRIVSIVLVAALLAPLGVAQSKNNKEKSPQEQALNNFKDARNLKGGAPNDKRIREIRTLGLDYLQNYADEKGAVEVVRLLPSFGMLLKGKAAESWLPELKVEADKRFMTASEPVVKAAFGALSAGIAATYVKEQGTRESLVAYRTEVDRLAALPGSKRFLPEQERTFLQLVQRFNVDTAMQYAEAMAKGKNSDVAKVATEELNLMKLAKSPVEFTFTSLQGELIDFAKMRDSIVYVYFWTTGEKSAVNGFEKIRKVHELHRKKGFQVVTVCLDNDATKAQILAKQKEKSVNYPVLHDGEGRDGEFAKRLNISGKSGFALFDKGGMFLSNEVDVDRLAGALDQLYKRK